MATQILLKGQEGNKEDVYSPLCGGKTGEALMQSRKSASEGIQGLEDTALQDEISGTSLGLHITRHGKRMGNRDHRKRQGTKQRQKVLGQESGIWQEQKVCQGK